MRAPAYILLEDGSRFDGEACGAEAHAVGEVVFTTGMSGYQESVTDPSFAGQLITFTYPHIGNYGVSAEAMESERAWARGVIMREACDREDAPGAEGGWLAWLSDCGVPAISGVDTRALVRHIREAGAMRGGIFPEAIAQDGAAALIAAEPPMDGQDLAALVTPSEITRHGEGGTGPRIAVIDTGIKGSIVRHLVARGARVSLYPCTTPAAELLAADIDAVLLANGPGDPAALGYVVDTVRELVGRRPADVQAAVRAPRREPPRQGPADRACGDHLPEPRLRGAGAGGSAHDRQQPPGALAHRLRRSAALARKPLRPHRRGPRAARRVRWRGPVPPRGRSRAARQRVPVRSFPAADRGGGRVDGRPREEHF